ncbi:hypothetical protein [Pseudoalteromonas sp.]|uniref:hypothetical protein n=1 Tax=Pseudoalteromonas sp. TaxID=53249 RepID=UPI0035614B08
MSKASWIFILLFAASFCGLLLLGDAAFLQHSHEMLWHVPYRSFVIMFLLVCIASMGKLIANNTFYQQGIANIGLYGALTWFPVSLIFSGNVRNIFSSSSLVSYETWLFFSLIPLMCILVLTIIVVFKRLFRY